MILSPVTYDQTGVRNINQNEQELFRKERKRKREFPGGLGIEDSVLSLLQHRFDPWARNFHMLQKRPREKERERGRKRWGEGDGGREGCTDYV